MAELGDEWWSEDSGFFGQFYAHIDANLGHGSGTSTADVRTLGEVSGILELCRIEQDRVLDCPCGYGRHSLAPASTGLEVVGLDLNRHHIEAARSAARDLGLGGVTFAQADMRELSHRDEFAVVINLYGSFGYFSEGDNLRVLEGFHRALGPGGRVLVHVDICIARLMIDYPRSQARLLATGERFESDTAYDPDAGVISGTWRLHRSTGVESHDFCARVYDQDAMTALMKQAGFAQIEVYGGWDGRPYRPECRDMIVIGHKAA